MQQVPGVPVISTTHFQTSLHEKNQFLSGRKVSGGNNRLNETFSEEGCETDSYFMKSSAWIKSINASEVLYLWKLRAGTDLHVPELLYTVLVLAHSTPWSSHYI